MLNYDEGTDGKVSVVASIDGIEFPCYTCEISVIRPELAKSGLTVKAGKSAKITVKKTKLKAKDGGGFTFGIFGS